MANHVQKLKSMRYIRMMTKVLGIVLSGITAGIREKSGRVSNMHVRLFAEPIREPHFELLWAVLP